MFKPVNVCQLTCLKFRIYEMSEKWKSKIWHSRYKTATLFDTPLVRHSILTFDIFKCSKNWPNLLILGFSYVAFAHHNKMKHWWKGNVSSRISSLIFLYLHVFLAYLQGSSPNILFNMKWISYLKGTPNY